MQTFVAISAISEQLTRLKLGVHLRVVRFSLSKKVLRFLGARQSRILARSILGGSWQH